MKRKQPTLSELLTKKNKSICLNIIGVLSGRLGELIIYHEGINYRYIFNNLKLAVEWYNRLTDSNITFPIIIDR